MEPVVQPGCSPSSPTLMGDGYGAAPEELLPGTWTWAMYSLSFGGLSLAQYSVATVGLLAATGPGCPVLLVALLIDVCISFMFFVGSAGTLTRDR
ncbi:MAG: hypothetical protein M3Y56_00325, partial [Armatimonadota bacterium]|nr:hypothetical protein [Armatimonadota bacterium]